MIYALVLALLSAPVTVGLVLAFMGRYLAGRDAADASERAQLYQRLQAPDTAVAQHVAQTTEYQPAHLPFDDDGAWMAHQQELSG